MVSQVKYGPPRKPLCTGHRAESDAWLDIVGTPTATLIARPGIQLMTIGDAPARVVENLAARAETVYGTIRAQQALIRRSCEAGDGCSDDCAGDSGQVAS
jgi:hypothetical protein